MQTRGRAGTSPEGHDHAASGCSCTTSQLRTPANRPLTHIRSRTDRTRHGAPARHATTCQHHAPASCDGRARASYTCTHAPTMYDAAAVPVAPQPDSTTFRPRTTVEPVPRTRMLTRRPLMTQRRRPSSHSTTFLPRPTPEPAARTCTRTRRPRTPPRPCPSCTTWQHHMPAARRSGRRLVHARARADQVRRSGRGCRFKHGGMTFRPRATVEPVPRTGALTRRPRMTRRPCPSSRGATFLPRSTVEPAARRRALTCRIAAHLG